MLKPTSRSTSPVPQDPPRGLALGQSAFFFDFDGTLVDIAPNPDAANLDNAVEEMLQRLARATNGALAIISGRDITDIDKHFENFRPAMSGGHGAEWRFADGETCAVASSSAIDAIKREFTDFASRCEGVIAEPKRYSVALHFRKRPELEERCIRFATEIGERSQDVELIHGKMVVELKPAGQNKGTAIRRFMEHSPFSGRQPIFVGDDVTDEDGFAIVRQLEGVAIKIGSGETKANYRLPDTAAFRDWLLSIVSR